jgi:hypothetical protein
LSSIKLTPNASGTGAFTIAAPNSNTDRTLTLPDATGTVAVSGQPINATTGSFSGDVTLGSSVLATPTGSAPSYTCRAWVNFNGTGTVAIRASGNVSSITDNGTGDYTVNFTTAMPDANYCPVCLLNGAGGGSVMAPYFNGAPSSSSYRIGTRRTDTFVATDTEYVNIGFFR